MTRARKAKPAAKPETARAPVTPIEPYLVPVASIMKGSIMPAAEPLNTADALKRILGILHRVSDEADRKKILAALAALA